MQEDNKLSNYQFTLLVTLFSIGASILVIPGTLTADAKQTAWIAVILGIIINMFIVFMYVTLSKYITNMTLIEYIEKLLGKWLGKVLAFFYFIFFLITCSTALWVVGEFVCMQMLPGTPKLIVYTTFLFIIIMGTRLGIEVIGRTAEILVVLILFQFVFLIILLTPEIEFEYIQPLFEIKTKSIIKSTFHFLGMYSLPNITLLMFYPINVKEVKKTKKFFYLGMIISGIILLIVTLYCILVLGPTITSRIPYPVFNLAQMITTSDFLSRIEVLFAIIWFITYFFRISIYFYSTVLTFSSVMNVKDYRVLTFPIGMILIVLANIIYPDAIYAGDWDSTTWIPFVTTFGLLFPLLLLIISMLKDKKNKYKYK